MPKHSSQMLQLARRGAEVRFRELLAELKILTLSFPHLRDAVDRDDLPVEFILRRGQEKAGDVQAARSRRTMSAKARAKISGAEGTLGEAKDHREEVDSRAQTLIR